MRQGSYRLSHAGSHHSVVDMVGTSSHVSYDVAMVRRTPLSRIMVVQNVPKLMKR